MGGEVMHIDKEHLFRVGSEHIHQSACAVHGHALKGVVGIPLQVTHISRKCVCFCLLV